MKKYDAIIIGGGVAGSLAAMLLARARLGVLLLEKNAASPSASRRLCLGAECQRIFERLDLGDGFNNLPHRVINRAKFSFTNQPSTTLTISDGIRCLEWETLTSWLREQAAAAGAELLFGAQCQSLDYARRLTTSEGEFQGKVVIGADGRNSWTARLSGFPLKKIRRPKTAWITDLAMPADADAVHCKFFHDGCLQLLPAADAHANASLFLNSNCHHAPQKFINDFFPNNTHANWHALPHATVNPTVSGRNNILLIGDAAKVQLPFTRQGITLALRSAELAARLVIETHLKGGWNILDQRYRHAHAELCRPSFRQRVTEFLVNHPSWVPIILNLAQSRQAAKFLKLN